jgi:hypothetical protein
MFPPSPEGYRSEDEAASGIDRYLPTFLHQASVLNTEDAKLSDEASRALAASAEGLLCVEDISPTDFKVIGDDLHGVPMPTRDPMGKVVLATGRIVHKLEDGSPGEFDGWFLGEEYSGAIHPQLLLRPARVIPKA